MLRAILAVIVGYVLMFVLVFATFSGAFLLMGMEQAYKPGVYEVTTMWMVVATVLGLLAAIAGGLACAMIAKTSTPVKVLVLLILVLGYGMGFAEMAMNKDKVAPPRPPNVTIAEAMQHSRTPTIGILLNPLIGMAGVMIGSRLARKKPATAG